MMVDYTDSLPQRPVAEEKPEPEPVHSVDVGEFSVAGIRLGMELDAAVEAANKHAEQRNIGSVRTQMRDGKVASLAWGNATEDTIVQLIYGTEGAPDKSRVKSIRYTFNNPEGLVAGAIEKYGEPSTRLPEKGQFVWCAAKSDVKSECNFGLPWMQIDTFSVSGFGILDAKDPTMKKLDISGPAKASLPGQTGSQDKPETFAPGL